MNLGWVSKGYFWLIFETSLLTTATDFVFTVVFFGVYYEGSDSDESDIKAFVAIFVSFNAIGLTITLACLWAWGPTI